MVECELSTVGLVDELITVLIDTWWNVNKNQRLIRFVCFRVLIDTWWNVNFLVVQIACSPKPF